MSVTIYHNPRCSKSRQTLARLEARGIEPEIVRYLDDPPDVDTLQAIVAQLGMRPAQLLRRGESEYRELGLAEQLDDDAAVLQAMAKHPRLIERPIVVVGDRARLGRPPESVDEILP